MKSVVAIILTALSLMLSVTQTAHADRTLRGKLRPDKGMLRANDDSTTQAGFDTIFSPADSLLVTAGYDKPLNSRTESLFITNRLDRELTEVTLRLYYSDAKGRMLHEATRKLRVIIPSGATRRVEFPSWDRQQTFYYLHGRKPRTANVSPFDVDCKVESAVVSPGR